MINLTLRFGDSIQIGPDITVRVNDRSTTKSGGKRVSLSIDAPQDLHITFVHGPRDGYDHSADDELLAGMLEPRS